MFHCNGAVKFSWYRYCDRTSGGGRRSFIVLVLRKEPIFMVRVLRQNIWGGAPKLHGTGTAKRASGRGREASSQVTPKEPRRVHKVSQSDTKILILILILTRGVNPPCGVTPYKLRFNPSNTINIGIKIHSNLTN